MTVHHDVTGSSPVGGAKEKADRKGGLFFLSLLLDFATNTAPRSGRGKVARDLTASLRAVVAVQV